MLWGGLRARRSLFERWDQERFHEGGGGSRTEPRGLDGSGGERRRKGGALPGGLVEGMFREEHEQVGGSSGENSAHLPIHGLEHFLSHHRAVLSLPLGQKQRGPITSLSEMGNLAQEG